MVLLYWLPALRCRPHRYRVNPTASRHRAALLDQSTISITLTTSAPSCTYPTCSVPCQHGALCLYDPVTSSASCSCPPLQDGFGWNNSFCDVPVCKQSCSGAAFGTCIDDGGSVPRCNCTGSRTGVACELVSCVPNCTANGVCVDPGRCECNTG